MGKSRVQFLCVPLFNTAKLFATPFKGWTSFELPPLVWLKLQAPKLYVPPFIMDKHFPPCPFCIGKTCPIPPPHCFVDPLTIINDQSLSIKSSSDLLYLAACVAFTHQGVVFSPPPWCQCTRGEPGPPRSSGGWRLGRGTRQCWRGLKNNQIIYIQFHVL